MLTTYEVQVQELYIAYFGRAADPAGLAFYAGSLSMGSTNIEAIASSFAISAEAQVIASLSVSEFVSAVYLQAFSRAYIPETDGTFWEDNIRNGAVSKELAMLEILQGAPQGGRDESVVANKIAVSAAFTEQVETGSRVYAGADAAASAKAVLDNVSLDSDTVNTGMTAALVAVGRLNLNVNELNESDYVILNTPETGAMGVVQDGGLFAVDLLAGTVYTVSASSDVLGQTYFNLYDSVGSLISDPVFTGRNEQAATTSFTADITGRYYLEVSDLNPVTTGDYTINLGVRITGTVGDDVLTGTPGDDVIRGGDGIDSMNGGAGDDVFVVVGDLSSGGKVDSYEDSYALGQPLSNLNGLVFNEDEDGAVETIRGGSGDDTLYVYGTADISNYDMTGIEHVIIRSDVTFSVDFLQSIQTLTGDGASTVRITSDETGAGALDLSQLGLSQIRHINLDDGTALSINSLDDLGGATELTGAGSIVVSDNNALFTGIMQSTGLNVRHADGTFVSGSTLLENIIATSSTGQPIIGTAGNDLINGGAASESIIGGGGSDIIFGFGGNDILWGDGDVGEDSIDTAVAYELGDNELVNGLGGGSGFGENTLYVNDDGSSSAIDITSVFGVAGLDFFGTSYTSLYVNNNGNVTFSSDLYTYTPGVIDGGVNNPIIAPFWADVDTRGTSSNTPTAGGNSTGSNRVWYDLDAENGVFTATWDDVGYFSSATDKLNAFQLQLIDQGSGTFDIVYRYENIDWTTGGASGGIDGLGGTVARAGYSAGNGFNYYELPQSGDEAEILALDEGADPYLFRVRSGVALATNNDDELDGGNGDDTLIGGKGNDILKGGSSWDVALYSGSLSDYVITEHTGYWTVSDTVSDRDGVDTVHNDVEVLAFSDQNFYLASSTEEIFSSSLVGEGDFNTGMLRTMADFSKAVYSVKDWEVDAINDVKPYTDHALNQIVDANEPIWVPLDLKPSITSGNVVVAPAYSSISTINTMADGFYTNGNATAFVARSEDSLVISFRGTNDNASGVLNFADGSPDQRDWVAKGYHYDLLRPLIAEIDSYVSTHSEIQRVYVTGHSLGGAMVSKFMDDHRGNDMYEAVTFAAPAYLGTGSANDNVIHFEINGDAVPDVPGAHPGRTIHIDGNETNSSFSANHSMDYYRQVMDVIDPTSWLRILGQDQEIWNAAENETVYLGAKYSVTDHFIVDGRLSGENQPVALDSGRDEITTDDVAGAFVLGGAGDDILNGYVSHIYPGVSQTFLGGSGDDTLTGGSAADTLYGDSGNDRLTGGKGRDSLYGGDGADQFIFSDTNEGVDTINDFVSGLDKFIFSADEFTGFLTSTETGTARLLLDASPTDNSAYFLFDTVTKMLSYDVDGHETDILAIDNSPVDISILIGVQSLSVNDFVIVV